MMNLNVEKDLNIREKAVVSLGIYRSFMESRPGLKENDEEVEDSIKFAEESPLPDPEELYTDVYANPIDPSRK